MNRINFVKLQTHKWVNKQGSQGIKQWMINSYTPTIMIINKITSSVDENSWWKSLNTLIL